MNLQQESGKIENNWFSLLDSIFKQKNWELVTNATGDIWKYVRPGQELDAFEIIVESNKIIVIVPIKNSIFSYRSSFTSYNEACEFIENKLYDFVD